MAERGILYTQRSQGIVRLHLSISDLERMARIPMLRLPASASSLDVAAIQASFLATSILLMFLGKAWVERNSMLTSKNRFLRGKPKDHLELNTHMARKVELAELLFNMQHIPGLDKVIDQIRDRMIESGFAELEAGKLLIRHDVRFRFIETIGKLGSDYDMELAHSNGSICCGEVKSKAEENTFFNQKTVMDSLLTARKQMPSDQPGIIFMKIPQDWYRSSNFPEIFSKAIKAFRSERVVSVIAFTNLLEVSGDTRTTTRASAEFLNNMHRFDKSLDWRLISGHPEPHYDPPNWIRLEKMCLAIGATFTPR